MPRYQHILFDLDGTLIDSAPAILASYREAFSRCDVAPARAIDESIDEHGYILPGLGDVGDRMYGTR